MCNAKGKQRVVHQGHEPEELGLDHILNFGILQANLILSRSLLQRKDLLKRTQWMDAAKNECQQVYMSF